MYVHVYVKLIETRISAARLFLSWCFLPFSIQTSILSNGPPHASRIQNLDKYRSRQNWCFVKKTSLVCFHRKPQNDSDSATNGVVGISMWHQHGVAVSAFRYMYLLKHFTAVPGGRTDVSHHHRESGDCRYYSKRLKCEKRLLQLQAENACK